MKLAGCYCENHPVVAAAAFCAVCLKPLCDDCAIERNGSTVCDESHAEFISRCTLIASVASPFEADAIATNLRSHEIEAPLFSFREHLAAVLAGAEDAAHVFVPKEQHAAALAVLNQLQLLE